MNRSSKPNYLIWKNNSVDQNFLDSVRGAIPLATEQIDCLLRLIALTQTEVNSWLDLGCGNGILGQAIANQYPQAQGVLVDISESMLQAAQRNFATQSFDLTASQEDRLDNYTFLLADFGKQQWREVLKAFSGFDVIVSGFAIHHQPDLRKKELYQEIFNLLNPGGIFLNLEHVASYSALGEKAFDQLFVDALYQYHRQQDPHQSRQAIAQNYYNRHDQNANILAPVETQCQWLREVGFLDVDCFMKLFEIALFGGIRSKT